MKIALVVPPLLKTPPTGYGGLEQVVYDLGCALVESGDEVTLFAPKGSHIDGAKVFETIEAPERTDVNWVQLEGNAYNMYSRELEQFDIVHDHSWFAFPYLVKMMNQKFKICHTHHGHLDWNPSKVPPQINKVNLIAISDYMSKEYLAQGWVSKFVYNGIDMRKYMYTENKGDRLVFVGRISKFKMPDVAIKAAMDTNTPIDIIGGSFVDDKAYLDMIKKMCENSNGIATLHLDMPMDEKIKIVGAAKANLVCSKFNEPFGLVAAEALACGTPVIAFSDGALVEVVGNNREAGYMCNSYDEFKTCIGIISTCGIKPSDCRKRAELFSRENMAKNYKVLYNQIIKGEEW